MNRDMTKGARFSFYGMQLLMGCVFWLTAVADIFQMSDLVYGSAVAYPAEYWAGLMMFPATVYLAALFINGRRWWTVYIRIAMGIWMMLYYSAFVVLAYPSAGVDLIVIGSSIFMAKSAIMLYFDGVDVKRKRHAGT